MTSQLNQNNPATGRRFTYLNGILTVNAVLLAGLMWTQIAGTSINDTASAQSRTRYADPVRDGKGVPDAGKQRMELVEAMRKLRKSIDSFYVLLDGGDIDVNVKNLAELKSDG